MSQLPTRVPRPTPETQPFWDAAADGRLVLARCDDCGLLPWYPRSICPNCQSTSRTWETLSGDGTVYSYSVTRAGGGRAWREHLPYVVAYVQLAEGPIIMTNIVDCDPESVRIDMAVSAVFHLSEDGSALVRFAPAKVPAKA